MSTTFEPLPRADVDVEKFQSTIVADSREQTPLIFSRLPCVRAGLDTGDYSVKGLENLFAVERKTPDDLAACCAGGNRERFERELARLRGYRFKRLLIIGTESEIQAGKYRSNIRPAAVLATLAAFEVRYDLPVVWASDPEAAAIKIESWAWWFSREVLKTAESLSP